MAQNNTVRQASPSARQASQTTTTAGMPTTGRIALDVALPREEDHRQETVAKAKGNAGAKATPTTDRAAALTAGTEKGATAGEQRVKTSPTIQRTNRSPASTAPHRPHLRPAQLANRWRRTHLPRRRRQTPTRFYDCRNSSTNCRRKPSSPLIRAATGHTNATPRGNLLSVTRTTEVTEYSKTPGTARAAETATTTPPLASTITGRTVTGTISIATADVTSIVMNTGTTTHVTTPTAADVPTMHGTSGAIGCPRMAARERSQAMWLRLTNPRQRP